MKIPAHIALGNKGEHAAAQALSRKGLRILAVNWRAKGALQGFELDIVAEEKETLVFVEVKTRTDGGVKRETAPYQAFTKSKQKKMRTAAQLFLTEYNLWQRPCRFDLVCIVAEPGGRLSVEHFENVIDSGNSLDSSDASWQPW